MTQYERVRAALTDGWTCGSVFVGWHILRYSARINEIAGRERWRRVVERRPCQNPYHMHKPGKMFEWRLVRKDAA